MLLMLLKMKCRTLVCASSNIAVLEVASRVLKLVKELHQRESGNDDSFCSLADILLFGNRERLNITSENDDIHLDHRVERLEESFAYNGSGWTYSFNGAIEFFINCASQYSVYMAKESISERESHEPGLKKSFLKFARDRFQDTANPLRRCLSTWCTHVPESIVGRHNVARMSVLTNLLDEFETFMYSDSVNSKDLKDVFSTALPLASSFLVLSGVPLQLCMKRDQCTALFKSIRSSLLKLDVKTDSIERFCFQNACIIFCTAASSHKLNFVGVEPIRLLVIDEAAQLRECESVIAMQIPDIRHAVLIGDECQLPSTVGSRVSSEAGFGRSLFERLSSLGFSKNLLKTQYRMHPSISEFPNAYFYDNQIVDAPRVQCPSYEKEYLPGPMFGPFSFINVFGGREEKDDSGSRRNMIEVAIIMMLLNRLYKASKGSGNRICIGVISPYAAQVVAIQERLQKIQFDEVEGFSLRVKSVDGFQGGEEDIIILSTVRSNGAGEIGFLSDNRRVNVALTRARYCLWILGDEKTLAKSTSSWEVLLRDAKERDRFFNAEEDKELADVIIQVKKDYVLFGADFRKSFRRLASVQTKTYVLNMILRLSSGWRPKRKNVDIECKSSSCILKQFKVENLYIICSIDIAKDLGMHTQVLKVWDVLPTEDIPELVKRLDRFFGRYTCHFLSLFEEKCLEGNLEVPQVWPVSSEIVRYQCSEECKENPGGLDGDFVESCKVSDSFLLMKFYSLSSGMASHLLSNCDGEELELPFEVTDEEMEVILFDRSMFLLGRSGSGKTTVLTTKLYRREQFYRMAVDGIPTARDSAPENVVDGVEVSENSNGGAEKSFLRQLFVTVSPKLCYAISRQVTQLKSLVSGGKNSRDITLDNEFIDGTSQFKDIPDSFVQMPPDAYPLVISFEKFLLMLDLSVGKSFFLRFPELRPLLLGKGGTQQSIFLENVIRTKGVSYDRFSSVYWPHFNEKSTKHLDCSRVYTEIMSYIKGGLQAASRTLGRDEYVRKKGRQSSLLNEQEGEMVYNIYEDYERKKKKIGDFDLADLVIDLETRLENVKYEGHIMDFVYIDEVQDLTMRQVALFKHICRNVDEGFVFAGDTAQTIARGVDFRFEDIRSLFYKEFMQCPDDDRGKQKMGQISKTFHLKQNFRTHIGVLNLAQTVIDLLYHFFPLFIDKVDPETSIIFGEAPVILNSSAEENAILTIFGKDSGFVGFGADQVILVWDELAKNEIYSSIGKQALVLTILESKGLEFQDVLLYNFFGTSPSKNKWRVIYDYMLEKHLIDGSSSSVSSSNCDKYGILCSELKQLYVAITRTRQRLWICENDNDPKPMFEYWMKKGVVQVQEVDASVAQKMQVVCSPVEWIARGFKLLGEKNYDAASMCFERAGDDYGVNLAKATALKASADRLHCSDPERAYGYRKKAAEIFESIGKADYAAECFYMLTDYERAGKLYYQCGASSMRRAGECFSHAGCFKLAAESYFNAGCLNECLIACDKGKLFDQGLRYIKDKSKNKKKNEREIYEQEFLERSAHHFYKLNDKVSMMTYVRTFSSRCTIQNFLRTYECYDELVSFEEEGGHFLEAAAAAKLKGDLLLEADLFGKAEYYKDALTLVLQYVLARALWSGQGRGWPLKKFNQMEKHLEKAKSLSEEVSPEHQQLVCLEADILSNSQSNLSLLMQQQSTSKSLNCTRGEIICCRMILDVHFCVTASTYVWQNDVVADVSQFSKGMLSS